MKNIFIDCGVWTGDSIREFKKYYTDYDIYGFECEPRLISNLKKLSKEYGFIFIDKAVWISDGKIKLYPGHGNLTQSSSISFDKKKYIDKKNPVEVKSVDFSKWILENLNKEDYILCKMNIEGAEYEVLEKMIKDNSIDYINKLYISWHWHKLSGFERLRHERIESEVKKRVELITWKFVEGQKENPFI